MLNAVFVNFSANMTGISGGNIDLCHLFERSEEGVGIDFAYEITFRSVQEINAAIV